MNPQFCYIPREGSNRPYPPFDLGIVSAYIKAKFWRNVRRGAPGECWLWTGDTWGKDGRQYGKFAMPHHQILAHEFSSILRRGVIPNVTVRQSCYDNLCVNPEHLVLDPVVPPAIRRRKLKYRCENGHLRTTANTFVSRLGLKTCRVCYAEREAAYLKRIENC